MSNVRPFIDHCKLQYRCFRTELADWWKTRTLGRKIVDVVLSPTIVGVVIIVLATYFNAIMSVYQDQRYAPGDAPRVLDDTLYGVLPYWNSRTSPNIMLYSFVAVTVVRFAPWWNGMSMRKSLAVYKRILLLEALVQIIRGFALGTTAPPPPDPNCHKVAFGSIWREGFNIMNGSKHTCGDLTISGHCGFYTLLALFWVFYSQGEEFNIFLPRRFWAKDNTVEETAGQEGTVMTRPASPNPESIAHRSNMLAVRDSEHLDPAVSFGSPSPLNWPPARRGYHLIDLLIWSLIIMASLVLVWTRYHYTSDIFIGFLVGEGIFRIYHLALTSLEWKLRHSDCEKGRHLTEEAPGLSRFTIPERFLLWYESPVLFRPHRDLHQKMTTGERDQVELRKGGVNNQFAAAQKLEQPGAAYEKNPQLDNSAGDVELGKARVYGKETA